MRLSGKCLTCVVAAVAAMSGVSVSAEDELSEFNLAYSDAGAADDTARTDNWRGFLGVGVIALERPIADDRVFGVPLVSVSYRDSIYWQFGKAGVWLIKSEDRSARVGLVVKARRGYDPEDFDGLVGMEKRHTSVEAGVNALWLTRPVNVSLAYYTDASGNSHGDSASFSLSHRIRLAQRWSLTPSIGAQWLSREVADYYFGVRSSEATASRPAYQGEGAVNWRAGMMAHYRVARDWSLFGGVSYTWLGSGVADSPIVIHDSIGALHVGGGWHF